MSGVDLSICLSWLGVGWYFEHCTVVIRPDIRSHSVGDFHRTVPCPIYRKSPLTTRVLHRVDMLVFLLLITSLYLVVLLLVSNFSLQPSHHTAFLHLPCPACSLPCSLPFEKTCISLTSPHPWICPVLSRTLSTHAFQPFILHPNLPACVY